MEKFKGTKGKWSFRLNESEGDEQGYYILANESHGWGAWVASINSPVISDGTIQEVEANAKLIASAPELLEALQEMTLLASTLAKLTEHGSFPKVRDQWNKANGLSEKAIQKALGNENQ